MDSWLHDTDSHKNFGPDLLLKVLMFNMHEIWSFDSQKNYYNCCHQMSDFKAKMHQNSISAVAMPQTPLGELIALPQTS